MLEDYVKKDDKERLSQFIATLSTTNRTPEYYVNWDKVNENIKDFEIELNTLNYLAGRPNIYEEAKALFIRQPNLLRAFPSLLATRDTLLDVLVLGENYNLKKMKSYNLDFDKIDISKIDEYMEFLKQTGILDFIGSKVNRNLVDYMYGVEAGLDSNARKNRGGTTTENMLESILRDTTTGTNLEYKTQATASWILANWGVHVPVDKSARRFDGAIYDSAKKQVWVIEINYYGSGGSKLKSVSGEFRELNRLTHATKDNVQFVWISDGQGWHTATHPLAEAFETLPYIFNLDMIKQGYLKELTK